MAFVEFLDFATDRLCRVQVLQALFLAGSYGRSDADQYSDLDCVALSEARHHEKIASTWRQVLSDYYTIVFWNERHRPGLLVNAITGNWLRIDLYIIEPSNFTGRSQNSVKPLFDRLGIYHRLPNELSPTTPNPDRVNYLVREFIRVLGLMPVVLGRREYVTMVKGVDMLRDLLTDLMLEECPVPDKGGILHLSRLLDAQQMAVLEGLEYPGPNRETLISANLKLAQAFFPRARRLADTLLLQWPIEFEVATRKHLLEAVGVDFFPSSGVDVVSS